MKAHARVVAEHHRGRSRCTTLRSAPPLTFRVTPQGLHLIGTSAGPVGGDELALDVTVAEGATLVVRSVASQLVLPGPTPAPSTLTQTIEVGRGASLCWAPEPLVVVSGADHRITTWVALAAGADLVWRDEVVLGRDGEVSGSLLQRIRIERDGRPLLCTEVALGPAWPTADGPAGTGAARVVASTVLVGAPARFALARLEEGEPPAVAEEHVRTGTFHLAENAVLLTALGHGLEGTRAALVRLGAPNH